MHRDSTETLALKWLACSAYYGLEVFAGSLTAHAHLLPRCLPRRSLTMHIVS